VGGPGLMHHFYAEFMGRIYKIAAEIGPDELQYAHALYVDATDIFTGERHRRKGHSFTPMNAMEVIAYATIMGDEQSGTEPQPPRLRLGDHGGEGQAEEAEG